MNEPRRNSGSGRRGGERRWDRSRLWTGAVVIAALAACASNPAREGLDVNQLPVPVRGDYAVFARRCSKCHALSRALNSGIDQDRVWVDYVNRMRRQPGSGITRQDMGPILRFLHYYSLDQQRLKRARDTPKEAQAAPAIDAGLSAGPGRPPDS
jgi:hypothetical protein